MLIYSTVINALSGLVDIVGAFAPQKHPRKFFRFIKGQRHIIKHIKDTYKPKPGIPTIWVHAASFGEYSVARPLLNEMKRRGMQTVVTFFSPTGYEAVAQRRNDVDHLYYLPLDTRSNVRAFLDTIKPDKAVFIVSEYWFNYLDLLRERNIATYLVSAKITDKSVFFKWYGKMYQKCLPTYKRIFTVDSESIDLLRSVGYDRAEQAGNPLFDNAIEKAETAWEDKIIASFTAGQPTFIAGSIHDEHDLQLVAELANRHPNVKFLMVPHEISPKSTAAIKEALNGKTLVYSECSECTDMNDAQALIIDFVGSLAYIYRYASWAYVGGGFTKYLHSLLEATVYGLPVAFGPMVHRKVTPQQIADLGIGRIVETADQLDQWFSSLLNSPQQLAEIKAKAKAYVAQNAGSTVSIINKIMK